MGLDQSFQDFEIVVTDDAGRYVIPELPSANYQVWVRGYGLVDSPKKDAQPGSTLDLEAVIAPNDAAAAQYYPAGYWLSLLHAPEKNKFPGTGPKGNGISPEIKVQADFLRTIKSEPVSLVTNWEAKVHASFRLPLENLITQWTHGSEGYNPGKQLLL